MTKPEDFNLLPATELGAPAAPIDPLAAMLSGATDDPAAHAPSDAELGTLEDEFRILAALREAKERAEEAAAEASLRYEAQKARMLAAMDAQGTAQFRSSTGAAASVREVYTTTVEDEPAFLAWVRERHPELLSVHSQRRTAFIRSEYADRGVPETDPNFPPGLKAGKMRTIQVRGVKR